MDDVWMPELSARTTTSKYTVTCRCGNKMRVRLKHFGRMCRCTKCRFPIYATYDNVDPPVQPGDRAVPRVFGEMDVPVHWQPGDLLLDRYEVKESIGTGGMGVVYRVYHRGWGKHLAVKCPSARLLGDEDWIEQFEHECETWINLPPHANVVECYYVRRLGGIPRVFVEYVKGRDLGHMIEQKTLYVGGQEAAMRRLLDIAIQICRGLHHAHEQGVIHQDVKPSNLLIGEDDLCKVTDFGLARVWVYEDAPSEFSDASGSSGDSGGSDDSGGDGSRAALQLKGLSGGTPTYRSPDQKRFGEVTHKTDIWSWGVSMIEMFSGDVYWTNGKDAGSVLDNLLTYGSRYDIVPRMPKRFEDLLKSCFEDDPDRRPPDMRIMARDIQSIYEEETGEPYGREETCLDDITVEVLNNRAVSMLDLNNTEQAEQLWEEVLASDPDHVESLYNRSLHYWKTGRITDGQMVELMYGICENEPDGWLSAYLLGRVLIERGDAALALRLFERIPQHEDNRREIAYGLAMANNYLKRDKKQVWDFKPDSIKVTSVSLSFDGWRVLTGGDDGQIRVWEVASRECTAVLKGHTDRVLSVRLSEDELMALSASADETLRIWDPVKGKALRTLKGHQGRVRDAALSSNSKYAVSASEDGTVMLWDTKTGKRLRIFHGHRRSVNAVALSRCGNYIFSGSSDRTIKQWDLWGGKCVRTFEGSESRITSLSLTRDGRALLSASDKYLQFWNVENGEMDRSFRGHLTEIFSVCLNETGRYALSATGMGTTKVWDTATGQCLRSFKGHAPAALSRDGRCAVSSGKTCDFKIWAVNLDEPPFPAQYVLCKGTR